MLKRSLAALAAVSLLTLAACSDDSDDKDTSAKDDSSQTTESGSPSADAGTATGSATAAGACSYPTDGSAPAKEADAPPAEPTRTGKVKATIATTVGDLAITLDADKAPCTVNSFVSLAEQGYYDDTTCHRLAVQEGFKLLQCGDPSATGAGGPGYSYADELDGSETYPAGTIAMANAGPDTNGSQFFLVIGDTGLPASYTVFGTFETAGIKALEKVVAKGNDDSIGDGTGKPNLAVDITKVTVG
ncbi:peptidylprolyl isomerase [Nocardioides dubius]|uniref:Peptidyl-prolyl cis-trans isomerase n=1 Tax=Nocardioides dubius TaxID=317019 RepID=A0ABP4E7N4_9ACTN